jgi:hypothetical protein
MELIGGKCPSQLKLEQSAQQDMLGAQGTSAHALNAFTTQVVLQSVLWYLRHSSLFSTFSTQWSTCSVL